MDTRQKPFGQINSSIGPLTLFASTAADQTALYKELGKRVYQCEPEEYVRRLARHICFPTDQLKKKASRPARPLFTSEDVKDLSAVDLEVFSALYIQNHPSLYRKFESARAVDKNGNPVISWKLEDVLHPKEDDESFIRYLHRLACLKEKRELEQAEKQAAKERLHAAHPARFADAEEIKKPADWARLFSKPALWFGAAITLVSICGLAVALHALSLIRYSAAAHQNGSAGDITLNINFELSRIAELLNSLQKAQTNARAASADEEPPPEPSAPVEDDRPPPPDTEQILEELRKDCQPSSP